MNSAELKITAELAHLDLSDEELAATEGSFEEMLGYFAAMQDAGKLLDLDALDGLSTPLAKPERFRPDAAAANKEDIKLVNNAGDHDAAFIIIPNVL